MSRQYVTDPNLLAQLNAPIPAAQQSQVQQNYVSDPALLAQLNSQSPSLGKNILGYGKAALSGLGQLGQTIAKDIITPGAGGYAPGINIFNSLPESAQNEIAQGMAPALSFNISKSLNVPQTTANELISGTFKQSPAIIASLMAGGSTLPEVAGSIAGQAGIGAALNKNDPESGAISGATLGALGSIAPAIIGKSAQAFIKGSMNRIVPYAKNLYSEAQKGYDVLDNMGKTKLIDPVIPTPKDVFGGIQSPEEVANFLQSIKGKSPANIDELQELQKSMEPSYSSAVLQKFDPDTLDLFNQIAKGNSKLQFNRFLNNPTAENAGILHRALGAARTGDNADIDNVFTNMRDQLKDNIIMPGVEKFGSPKDYEQYGNADLNYRQFKSMFGHDSEIENFASGNIDPEDMTANRYYNMLKKSKEAGAFNSAAGLPDTIPMQEFKALQQKMINPGFIQNVLNKATPKAQSFQMFSPLLKTGYLGYSGTNQ